MSTQPCRFCGQPVPSDPIGMTLMDEIESDIEFRNGICDACARKAWDPSDGKGNLAWARARLGLFPELAR